MYAAAKYLTFDTVEAVLYTVVVTYGCILHDDSVENLIHHSHVRASQRSTCEGIVSIDGLIVEHGRT